VYDSYASIGRMKKGVASSAGRVDSVDCDLVIQRGHIAAHPKPGEARRRTAPGAALVAPPH